MSQCRPLAPWCPSPPVQPFAAEPATLTMAQAQAFAAGRASDDGVSPPPWLTEDRLPRFYRPIMERRRTLQAGA